MRFIYNLSGNCIYLHRGSSRIYDRRTSRSNRQYPEEQALYIHISESFYAAIHLFGLNRHNKAP